MRSTDGDVDVKGLLRTLRLSYAEKEGVDGAGSLEERHQEQQ